MGVGDALVRCNVNHAAATIAISTTCETLTDLPGCNIATAAARAFCIIRTPDPGSYGGFILRKKLNDLPGVAPPAGV